MALSTESPAGAHFRGAEKNDLQLNLCGASWHRMKRPSRLLKEEGCGGPDKSTRGQKETKLNARLG